MRRATELTHKFVETIPEELEAGVLYISMIYGTVVHKCCCGCGSEVVTPLGPTDWKLIYDGVSISLRPSIGNWNLDCRSHYWIDGNIVKWADQWSTRQIEAGRTQDRRAKKKYFDEVETARDEGETSGVAKPTSDKPQGGIWARLFNWLSR